MEKLKRRGFLKLLAATGAAAVCGLKAGEAMAQSGVAEVAKTTAGAEAITEATEASLEPNQFYVVRRRRWRRRRVVYYRPRRRRVVYLYRRPRRYYRVRRWRRW